MDKQHYLEKELYSLMQSDQQYFDFLQEGSLDGLWYWDLLEQENEWMSPSFWRLFGYDPNEKKHFASEWQDMIFEEDLETALINFKKHLNNPDCPYDQVVRYRHKKGHTVWVRCRGIAIRDNGGRPVRMLGAHNDISQLMLSKAKVTALEQQVEALKMQLEACNMKNEMLQTRMADFKRKS